MTDVLDDWADSVLDALDSMEAEAGCELPDLVDPTPCQRAVRLLACEDPPRGQAAEICRWLARHA